MDISGIITGVLHLVVLYLIYTWYNKKSYWEQRGVPHRRLHILRTLKSLFISKKSVFENSLAIYKEYSHEPFMGVTLADTKILVVRDPDLIKRILLNHSSHFEDRSIPIELAGKIKNLGVQSLTGEKWRLVRHKLTPSFSSSKMKVMFSQMKECSEEFVLYLKGRTGQDLETSNFLFKFMMNLIANIAFSMKIYALNDSNANQHEFVEKARHFFNPTPSSQIKMILFSIFPKLKSLFKLDESFDDYFMNLVLNLIKERNESGLKRNDFLQVMLDQREKELEIINNKVSTEDKAFNINSADPAKGELFQYLEGIKHEKDAVVFTDKCIAAQTFLFISEGNKTVSSILSFTLHELAVNQDIQKKVQAEIDSVLSTNEFNYDAIKKMTYMEQVLNEVLRLRTPLSVTTRICGQEYQLPGTDVVLEKGCIVKIPAFAIHRDPNYFPEPETFNPDRFEDMNSIPKGVFLPFGSGPRMCIGKQLAMLEMKVFLATVLSSYTVIHSDKTPLPLVMFRRCGHHHVKDGLWVKFEARQ